MEAAAHILDAKGFEGFNTNAVAERAGVSVGSLYQYFPNKNAVLAALIARHQDQRASHLMEKVKRLDGLTLIDGLKAIISATVAGEQTRPQLSACLDHAERMLSVEGVIEQAGQKIDAVIAKYLTRFASRTTLQRRLRAARTVRLIVRAIVDDGLNCSAPNPAQTIQEATRAAHGYLAQGGLAGD